MHHYHWIGNVVFLADVLVRLGLSWRVIHRRLPVGVSLAWLAIILIFPFVGATLYLLLGEYRLGRRRAGRSKAFQQTKGPEVAKILEAYRADPALLASWSAAIARLAESTLGAWPLRANDLQLLENAEAAFPVLLADIDAAKRSCFLEFYIWSNGGLADELGAALIRAAQRGVECRVLVDAMGSHAFLKSNQARALRRSGIRVEAALRSGLLTLLFVRPDLRMHRKIALIDGTLGFTGSLNLADPRLFKKDAGVGQWVDALTRVQGPAVLALAEVFREDWFVETGELLTSPDKDAVHGAGATPRGAIVQVLPTGPGANVEAIERIVLMALYAAKDEVVLTTPYFVPSESLLSALLSAAERGVKVILIVPAKIDSRLVHFASRAFQMDLLKAGVQVALFQGGLLHTKSITVDGEFCLFGSLNLDPRSLRLDLEITLAIHDTLFAADLRRLQQFYLEGSAMLDLNACNARSTLERFAEDTARLVGPVL